VTRTGAFTEADFERHDQGVAAKIARTVLRAWQSKFLCKQWGSILGDLPRRQPTAQAGLPNGA